MNKEEIKDVINNLIKDDAEAATQGLHRILAAKMQDRIQPSEVKPSEFDPFEIEEVVED
jgi:hypothetical protein